MGQSMAFRRACETPATALCKVAEESRSRHSNAVAHSRPWIYPASNMEHEIRDHSIAIESAVVVLRSLELRNVETWSSIPDEGIDLLMRSPSSPLNTIRRQVKEPHRKEKLVAWICKSPFAVLLRLDLPVPTYVQFLKNTFANQDARSILQIFLADPAQNDFQALQRNLQSVSQARHKTSFTFCPHWGDVDPVRNYSSYSRSRPCAFK